MVVGRHAWAMNHEVPYSFVGGRKEKKTRLYTTHARGDRPLGSFSNLTPCGLVDSCASYIVPATSGGASGFKEPGQTNYPLCNIHMLTC
ncbi:hypothetical protein BDA96_06G241500 [Sorghum bicolor]|uniref:Uncharacterized protein n=2 Tax=Sorghum bicolor TaxID=4558 RepID=A0A921QTT5_SORBI|nr:hypothetical protein BDA96_06G241500 [Sorghum bicolor]KXG27143.1 hypothetical protein SORBI_3006G220300 [Sorghum bicolor]